MKSLIFLLLIPCFAVGQDNTSQEVNPLVEDVLTMDENNTEDGAAQESLAQFLSRPFNLNMVTAEELKSLSILSAKQIDNILLHRKENGAFISAYELQTVEGLDEESIRRLAPFVIVKPPSEAIDRTLFKRIRRESDNYFMMLTTYSLEEKKGFSKEASPSQQFEGSQPKMLLRYRSSRPGDFSFGLTAEKDEGEKMQWARKKKMPGFDYLSFHIQLQNKGKWRNIILGDFQCQFGQGLVWGGAAGFGKGAETINTIRKANVGLIPYTSAYESGFFRGVGTTIRLREKVFLSTMFSSVWRDANLQEADFENTLTSIQTTGLHRTKSEVQNRKTLGEKIAGGVLQYNTRNLDAGVTFQHISYSAAFEPLSRPYNQFAFSGHTNSNVSAFLNYSYYNLAFFSEFAYSMGHGSGYIAGLLANLSKKLEISLLHRKYDRDFYPFYNNGFSENTISQNEKGIYWGWKYKFNRRYTLSGYADLFQFPWLKFRTYAPSSGIEILTRFAWQPSKTTTIYIQARQEQKARNTPNESSVYHVANAVKYNLWINADYSVHPALKMRTRIQSTRLNFHGSASKGLMFFHDITLTLQKIKCTARYALFDADDFDNRLYAYEHEVWMAYSLPAYYGTGVRKYLVVQYKWNKAVTIWMKYSNTRYTDRQAGGTGSDAIDGNKRNELKLEARIKF